MQNLKNKAKIKKNFDDEEIAAMSDADFEAYLEGLYSNPDYAPEDEMQDADTAEEVDNAAEEAADNEEVGNTPYKTFATEEEFNAAAEQYAQSRYGDNLRQGQEAIALRDRLSGLAKDYYEDDEQDPMGRLVGDLESQNASRRSQTTEQYRQSAADKQDAEAYRNQQAQQQSNNEMKNAILQRWQEETARLQQAVPDFDLDTAMENEEFREMVVKGASVDGAYYAVKYNELKGQQGQLSRQPIPQNGQMKSSAPHGSSINDLTSLSDKDFKAQLRRIMRGE